ncbi:MAG: VOC family protein [Rhodospirillales bacterium]|nr:VOC family protein [Rhodospirillales bacterium]
MEQRISLLTIGVGDLEKSRKFYERLGWRRSVKDAKGVAFFQAGGIVLSLYPRADLAKDAQVAAKGSGFPGFAIAYNARTKDEVDRVLAEASAAGATILRSGGDAFWGGYFGFFADPDGYLWEVAWNPHFPIDAEGIVRLPE